MWGEENPVQAIKEAEIVLRIKEAIVVEGRYDKNTLSQMVDTVIIETKGFGVFRDKELLPLLRRLAQRRGLIIFTDPDGAGFVIRNYLKGAIEPGLWKNAYIPDIQGKERRKRSPGAEGKLGVEGMRPEQLEEALRRAGATFEGEKEASPQPGNSVTKADLYTWGLSGRPDSAARRQDLLRRLELPEHLSAGGLLEVLNALYSKEELKNQIENNAV